VTSVDDPLVDACNLNKMKITRVGLLVTSVDDPLVDACNLNKMKPRPGCNNSVS